MAVKSISQIYNQVKELHLNMKETYSDHDMILGDLLPELMDIAQHLERTIGSLHQLT